MTVHDYETEWANTDPDIQDAALDALGAETVDDVICTWLDEEDVIWLWKDLMGVVRHKEHELGLF